MISHLFRLGRNRGKDDSDDGPYFIPRMPKGPTHRGYIPARLWCIVSLMLRVFKPMRPFSVADCFAGKCAISKAFIRNNMRAAALDFELDQRDEIWQHAQFRVVAVGLGELVLGNHGIRNFPHYMYIQHFPPKRWYDMRCGVYVVSQPWSWPQLQCMGCTIEVYIYNILNPACHFMEAL